VASRPSKDRRNVVLTLGKHFSYSSEDSLLPKLTTFWNFQHAQQHV